ncbi:hypothetical protein CONPUDRAFT_33640, partial [Coniophora puteana RWD-64-598 SS2]
QVEDTLFCVPRSMLQRYSDVFKDLFELPTSESTGAEGESKENPIVLEDIKAWEFKQLLKTIFFRHDDQPVTQEEWVAVLKLTHRWEMAELHRVAMESLSAMPMDPVEKAGLAQDLDIQEWKLPAYQEIARRSEPLTMSDVDRLGLDTILKLAAVRESIMINV